MDRSTVTIQNTYRLREVLNMVSNPSVNSADKTRLPNPKIAREKHLDIREDKFQEQEWPHAHEDNVAKLAAG